MASKKVKAGSGAGVTDPTWEGALRDAKNKLEAARRRVRELTLAVRVCEERVRAGDVFPGQHDADVLGRGE